MPILGITASAMSGHLFNPTGNFESIQTVTVGSGGSSTITFSSIPQTYQHLQIRISIKGAYGPLRFNGDTGSNYRRHWAYGNGTIGSGSDAGTWMDVIDSSNTANVFAGNIVDILDYTNTSKYKTARIVRGADFNNGSGSVSFLSGLWMSTSAVTSITLNANGLSGSFSQFTTAALYGVK